MTEKRGNKRLFFATILSLILIFTCIFALTSCDPTANSEHKCLFGGQKLEVSSVDELQSRISGLTPGTYYFYLTKSLNVTKTINVPEGVFVGICRNVNNVTVSDGVELYRVVDTDISGAEGYGTVDAGGLYLFSCGTHAIHAGKTYYKAEQSMFDLFSDSGNSIYSKFAVGGELNIALTSDLVIDDESFVIPNGYTLRICLNSPDSSDDPNEIHELTIADGLDLTKNGGELIVINCMSSTYHECIHLDNNKIIPIDSQSQTSMDQVFSKLNSLNAGDVFYGYLVNDLAFAGELSVKEGVTVMICLNGFSMDANIKTGTVTETVTDPNTGTTSTVTKNYGNAYIFDCSNHLCEDVCDNGKMFALKSSSVNWMYDTMRQFYVPSGTLTSLNCVLEEDIPLEVVEGYHMHVCLNGYKDRESVTKTKVIDGVETVVGSITYYNCASMASTSYHSCSVISTLTMGAMSTSPIDVTSAKEMTDLFSGFETSTPYMLHLNKDVLGGGTVRVPDGVIVVLCQNGHTMTDITFEFGENAFAFVYQCSEQYCEEAGKEIPAFDQRIFDFLEMVSGGGQLLTVSSDMYLSVSEDVDIPSSIFKIAEGGHLHICSYGHNVTGFSGVAGATIHTGCENHTDSGLLPGTQDIPQYKPPHDSACFVPSLLGMSATAIDNMTVAQMNETFAGIPAGQLGAFYYLESDLSGIGTLTAPENMIVGICLNGYTMSDTITLGEGVYVYECKEQYCREIDGNIHSVNQAVFDFISSAYEKLYPDGDSGPIFFLQSDMWIAISEDVIIPDNMFAMDGGAKLYVCTCGYNFLCNSELVSSGDIVVHSGCSVGGLHCAVCDRNKAKPFTYETFTSIVDDDGRIILPAGSYYFYLENDFQLTRSITVPNGVDIHICLNGYKLYSPYIWADSKTFGYGYPESPAFNVANVEEGGVFNIYDCSEGMTGTLGLKFFRKYNSSGIKEMLLTVSDDNKGFEGLGEGLGAVVSAYISNIAMNSGTINIYGGNFNSMVGFINQGNGVINIYRGNVNAAWAGVIQAAVNSGSAASSPSVYIGEGGTLSAGAIGIYGMGGDITLDGGTINAGFSGISVTASDNDTSSTVTLNGGNVNVGDLGQMTDTTISTWVSAGGDPSVLDLENSASSFSEINAVSTDDKIVINGDVNVNTGNLPDLMKVPASDMKFSDSTSVEVSDNVTNNYTLTVDGKTVVGQNDIFTPNDGYMEIINADGELVVLPVPSGDAYASLHGISVSTNGEITLNLYAKAISGLEDRILLYVQYDESSEPVAYRFTDADTVNRDGVDTYRFELPVAAKDYAHKVTYYFVLLPAADGVSDSYSDFVNAKMGITSVSVEDYLNELIENPDKYGESSAKIALAMKNYCAAAAKHFGVSDSYEAPEELKGEIDAVDVEKLQEYAPKKECAEDSKAVFKTVTLMLKSKTAVRIYFDIAEGYTLDDIDVAVSFGVTDEMLDSLDITVAETGYSSRPYYVEISGIRAKDLDKTFTVTIDKLTVNYSVMSYVYTVLKNQDSFSEDLVDLVKALVLYNEKATTFFECDHVYDNACDSVCNSCGYSRPLNSHNYETVVTLRQEGTTCVGAIYDERVVCTECGDVSSSGSIHYSAPHVPGEVELTVTHSYCDTYTLQYNSYCTECSTPENPVIVSSASYSINTDDHGMHIWSEPDAEGKISCTNCGVSCSASGHTEATVDGYAPTCTQPGRTSYKYCTVCGEATTLPDAIAPKGHTAKEPEIENNVLPTCATAGGYDKVVYCADCGSQISSEHVVVPALEHTAGEAVKENVVALPTCTAEAGYDSVVRCTVCNGEISRTHITTAAPTGHTPAEATTETVDATCTSDGYTDTVICCKDCGIELSRVRTVNKLAAGHTYQDGSCTVCSKTKEDEGGSE